MCQMTTEADKLQTRSPSSVPKNIGRWIVMLLKKKRVVTILEAFGTETIYQELRLR